ncbi:hypothetical protein GKZ28_05405 [Clostridium chromiireducens]|uniref:Uncharacterized protein n=1 Tax=Clostridium chromiireducens TaxID=225345 RepID=A0A964RK06_9CLOT|nr:hypothetical protein [Clostridium chromiireducens]MVX63134.1 hypothetical protein [Clostridium chromiireducens]
MEALTSVVTFLFTTMGTVVTTVTANPMLAVGIGIPVVGGAIALFKRLV